MTTEFERSENLVWRVIELVTVVCFLATLAVMFVQVMSRYALGIAVPWTDEASRYAFIVSIFLGAALCQKSNLQVRITVLLDILPKKFRYWFEAASDVLTILIALFLIIGAFKMGVSATRVQAATLPVSFAWLYAFQFIGLVLVVVAAAHDVIGKIKRARSELDQ